MLDTLIIVCTIGVRIVNIKWGIDIIQSISIFMPFVFFVTCRVKTENIKETNKANPLQRLNYRETNCTVDYEMRKYFELPL